MQQTFENNLKKLEDIVNRLEKEEISLEKSLKMFEEGISIVKKLNEVLNKTEKKVEILISDGKKELKAQTLEVDFNKNNKDEDSL